MASEIMEGISEFYVCRALRTEWFDTRTTTPEEAAAAGFSPAGAASSIVAAAGSLPAGATKKEVPKKGAVWDSVTTHCGAFSPAQHWACTKKDYDGGHYRCARCGTMYQPWVSNDKVAPMNKLLIIEAGDRDVAKYWKGKVSAGEPKGLATVSEDHQGTELIFVPFQWGHSTEQALGDRLKEVALQIGASLEGKPRHELPGLVAKLALEKQIKKCWWGEGRLTEKAKETIDQVNGTTTREAYNYGHLLDGFPQGRFEWQPGQVVWSQDELAKAYSLMRIAIREAKAEAAARAASRGRSRGK